jgi:hypothetical protein
LTLSSTATVESLPTFHDASVLRMALEALTLDQRALSGWLRSFDDPNRAFELARRSYWHPNGFAKLVIQTNQVHKIRLHVWPAGENRPVDSNPHGHRWNFASTVLGGDGLQATHYIEAETGTEYERYLYAGGNVAGALTHVRTVRLAESNVRVLRAGDRYTLDTSVVHTVRPLGTALVATLVVQGVACLDSAPVYGRPGVDVDEPGRAISADEVRGLIREVLAAVDAPLGSTV